MLLSVITDSDYKAVGATEVDFDVSLAEDAIYAFTTTTNCFITLHATAPAASAADASMLVCAGQTVYIEGKQGAKMSVIRDTADGKATLTRVKVF